MFFRSPHIFRGQASVSTFRRAGAWRGKDRSSERPGLEEREAFFALGRPKPRAARRRLQKEIHWILSIPWAREKAQGSLNLGKTGRTSVMCDLLAGPASRDLKWFCFHLQGSPWVAVGSAQGLAPARLGCLGPKGDLGQPGQQSIQEAICPIAHPEGNGGDFMATLFVLSA